MKKFYIWVKPDVTYYYKFIRGCYIYNHIGDINQYNHKLIMIIDSPYMNKHCIYHKRLLKRLIGWVYKKL